jgi:RNA polymerase sigma-70 factor (ECF subfamily)
VRDACAASATADALTEDAVSDERLAVQALRDREAFAALYRRYARPVYGYVRRRVRSETEAEEVTAEVFLAALNGVADFRGEAAFTFRAWLFRIAHRRVVDFYRSQARRDPLLGLADVEVASLAQGMADIGVRLDLARRLRHLLRELPDAQREALLLRHQDGLSTREVAHVLGRSEGAVRVLLHRAVAHLRRRWLEEEEQDKDPEP